jgi:hypothetical protein
MDQTKLSNAVVIHLVGEALLNAYQPDNQELRDILTNGSNELLKPTVWLWVDELCLGPVHDNSLGDKEVTLLASWGLTVDQLDDLVVSYLGAQLPAVHAFGGPFTQPLHDLLEQSCERKQGLKGPSEGLPRLRSYLRRFRSSLLVRYITACHLQKDVLCADLFEEDNATIFEALCFVLDDISARQFGHVYLKLSKQKKKGYVGEAQL